MPAPPPSGYGYGQQGPSCFDRIKLGFMMGFSVGLGAGVLFGGFSGLRYGVYFTPKCLLVYTQEIAYIGC